MKIEFRGWQRFTRYHHPVTYGVYSLGKRIQRHPAGSPPQTSWAVNTTATFRVDMEDESDADVALSFMAENVELHGDFLVNVQLSPSDLVDVIRSLYEQDPDRMAVAFAQAVTTAHLADRQEDTA